MTPGGKRCSPPRRVPLRLTGDDSRRYYVTSPLITYKPMLPDYVKKMLAPYFPEIDMEDIRIREGIPWYVPMNVIAYTNRNRIYFAHGCYDPDSLRGIALIAHELTHCAQYKNHGTWRFRVLYVGSWLKELWRHWSFDQAYSRNRFEVAARVVEQRVFADLSDWHI